MGSVTSELLHTIRQVTGRQRRQCRLLKNSLRASVQDGQSLVTRLARFLMTYRTAPQAATGRSPAEMLYGRNLRTRFDLLRPDRPQEFSDYQERMAEASGGRQRSFSLGEDVWTRSFSGPKWRRGRIAAQTGPVSYEVDIGDACWSRHADQLVRASRPERLADPEAVSENRWAAPSRLAEHVRELLPRHHCWHL